MRQQRRAYQFGDYTLETKEHQLRRGQQVISLRPKTFETLLCLVEHHGHLVTKNDLIDALWGDTMVTEGALAYCIKEVRKVLEDNAQDPRYIKTVPRVGYKFIAQVEEIASAEVEEDHELEEITALEVIVTQDEGSSFSSQEMVTTGRVPRSWSEHWPTPVGWIILSALIVALFALAASWLIHSPTATESSLTMKTVPFTSYPGREADPAFSPDGNQIAFSWDSAEGGNFDIYVKLINAGHPLRLTAHPGDDVSPAWSPDGRLIAFIHVSEDGNGIYTIPALGGRERKLHSIGEIVLRQPHNLSWSSDGKFLAFPDKPSAEEPYSIFLLSVEGLKVRRLTMPPSRYAGDLYPVFSPDGQSLAFARYSEGVTNIYRVPTSGGPLTHITSDNQWILGLDWTPDGQDIVFSSNRGGSFNLWRVPISSGKPERLAAGGENAASVSISRQGNRLAYTQFIAVTNIWRVNARKVLDEPAAPQIFISSTRRDEGPQFSPDGRKIVFQSNRSGNYEIWMCDSDGSNPVQLSSFISHTGTPRWSPDGQNIVFDSRPQGQSDLYIISAEGGEPRRLTREQSDDVVPSWSMDRRWVYFASNRSGSWQVWKVSIDGQEEVQVTRKGGFAAFESPDGRFVYYAKGLHAPGIWRVPAGGGEESEVSELLKPGLWGHWVLFKQGIYFVNPDSGVGPAIELLNLDTGRVGLIARLEKEPAWWSPGLALSPDGQWILYSQEDKLHSDIVLVDDFH